MRKRGRPGGFVDRSETFDELLAKYGLLAETEDAALKEITAGRIKVVADVEGLTETE